MVDLNGKTILVTGGCGFIGGAFIELCMEEYDNLSIINIDKLGIGSRTNLFLGERNNSYTHIREDLSSLGFRYKTQYGLLVDKHFDYVFHFAAESHVDRSINSPEHFIQNNVIGTANLLSYVHSTNPQAKVICISTDEVYGHLGLDDKPFTTESLLNPRSPYAASKASSDLVALSYKETYGLDLKITRCCNNFGQHQASEKFIPTILRNIINKTEIPVYGTGQNIREWIYVHDHNRAILKVADSFNINKTIWNIGSGVEKTNLELIDDIGMFVGITPLIKFVEDRKAHDFRYAITNEVHLPSIPYIHALQDTVEFYKNNN